MKRTLSSLLAIVMLMSLLSGCAKPATDPVPAPSEGDVLTDTLGNTVSLPDDPRVVSLYGSFAQCWLLSGGTLCGVTEDAVEEHGIETGDKIRLVGSVKEPSLEQIAALSPDYVLLSADLTQHLALDAALSDMQIPHGYFRMDTFEDYNRIMADFCAVNGDDGTRYAQYVTEVQSRIDDIKSEAVEVFSDTPPRVLLLRAYSTGVKAKTADILAGVLLDELGAHNIAYDAPSLLEELSVEAIIAADPDFIFVTTMGSAEAAETYMLEAVESNPAWAGMTAVQNGRYIFLPKDLFHHKPLNRWDESYAYLAEILLEKTE